MRSCPNGGVIDNLVCPAPTALLNTPPRTQRATGSLSKNPWAGLVALWALTVGLPDLLWRRDLLEPRYLVAMAASVTAWGIVAALLARVRERSRGLAIVLVVVFAFVITVSMGISHGYHRFFRKDFRALEWEFALENPVFSLKLLTTAITPIDRILLPLELLVLTLGMLWLSRQPPLRSSRLLPWPALVALVPIAAITFYVRPLSGDLVFLRAAGMGTYTHVRRGGTPQTLPLPARAMPPPGRPRHAPDVVLIVNESVGAAESLREAGFARKTAAFVADHAEHTVSFAHAETVATGTCVSIPTILTGLHSTASRDDFAHAPLAWQDAHALGYRTGLFSAQEFQYEFFDQFFLGKEGPDEVRTAADYVGQRAERVNEMGVDEAQVVDDAIRFMNEAPAERPFFAVIHFNSTHWPCWSPSIAAVHWSGSLAMGLDAKRCASAVQYVDDQTARIFDALSRSGRLESTLLVLTSDHGEVYRPERPIRRYSFLEDVLAIPFVVHLPADMAAEARALHDNASLRVSNLDIEPTLLDVWGRWPLDGETARGRPALSGQSLIRPVSPDRVLVSVTDSPISSETKGFAVYHGKWKWMVTEQTGLQLFDLEADPQEQVDRSKEAPPDELRRFHEEVSRYPRVQKVLEEMGSPRSQAGANAR